MKKKLLSIVAMATTLFLAFSLTSIVNAAVETTVTDNTASDSYVSGAPVPTITTEGDTTTVVYDSANLKTVEADPIKERPGGFAWVGIKATATGEEVSKWEKSNGDKDSGTSIVHFFAVSADKLKDAVENGKDLSYTLTVKWLDGSDNVKATHTINVIIKAKGITLKDKDTDDVLWNEAKYEEVVKEVEAKKAAEAKKEEKDTTYKTGSSVAAIALISAMVSIAGIAIIKR